MHYVKIVIAVYIICPKLPVKYRGQYNYRPNTLLSIENSLFSTQSRLIISV